MAPFNKQEGGNTKSSNTTLFRRSQSLYAMTAKNSNILLESLSLRYSKILRKSSEITKLFCKYPPLKLQTARAYSHHRKMWPLVSGSKPHIGQRESGTIFRLKRLPLVGRISLQALQIKKNDNPWNFQAPNSLP